VATPAPLIAGLGGSAGAGVLSATTITAALETRAAADCDKPFVRIGDETAWLSYQDIARQSRRLAAALQLAGVRKAERIATILPNCAESIELVFALSRLGAIQVSMNIYAKGELLRHQLVDSDPQILIADALGLAAAAPFLDQTSVRAILLVGDLYSTAPVTAPVESLDALQRAVGDTGADVAEVTITPDDIAAISYTSGTSGPAKGCLLSHGYYTSIGASYARRNIFQHGDRVLSAMPGYHLGAISLLISALTVGFSVRLEPRFSASSFMATAAAEDATIIWGTGTMGTALLAQPPGPDDAASPVERALFVPMRVADQEAFERRYNCAVFGSYGQTELLVVAAEDPTAARRRSSGRPVESVEVRIADELGHPVPDGDAGEILVRPRAPHGMFSGYWRDPEATAAAWSGLWHHTGDFGRLDQFGELRFVDRKKDAIRRRGENVSCQEVEMVLLGHPAVEIAAVFGVPAPLGEDDIVACLAIRGAHPEPAQLFAFFTCSLPYFAVPRYLRILPELPLTATGKVAKSELRAQGITADTLDFEELGLRLPADRRRQA
jgi:crotonobetaine/carnitine-CoA ligase